MAEDAVVGRRLGRGIRPGHFRCLSRSRQLGRLGFGVVHLVEYVGAAQFVYSSLLACLVDRQFGIGIGYDGPPYGVSIV